MAKTKQQKQNPPKATPKQSNNKSFEMMLGLMVATVAFVLYFNTLNHGFALDDFSVIRENNVVMQGSSAIPTIFKTSYRYGYLNLEDGLYRPLSLAMFATEWEISPDNPSMHHWVNVLLYALTAFLLFSVLRKLLSAYTIAIPLLATLLFVVHPVHTEVVANIKSRDEILSLLFTLCSLTFLLKATDKQNKLQSFPAIEIALSALFFFIGLLSKESGITMLAGFPLLLWGFKNVSLKRAALLVLPHLAATFIFLIIRYNVLGGKLTDTSLTVLDNFIIQSPDFFTQFATAVKVLGLYLKLFVLPHPLLYDYSYNKIPAASFSDVVFLLSFAAHAAAGVYALVKIKDKNFFAICIFFYLISISLFSNVFLKIGVGMAERLLYFPSLAICLMAAYGLTKIFKENVSSANISSLSGLFSANKVSLIVCCIIAFLFSIKTIARNPAWKDNFTLYSTDLERLKESTRAHYYLGNEIIKNTAPNEKNEVKRKQLFEQGIALLKESLRIYPSYSEALSQLSVGYYKIADYPNAVVYSKKALEHNPNDIITLNNLGSSLFQTGKPEEALKLYERVVKLNPRYEDGWMNLGSINGMAKRFDEAIKNFNTVLSINPNNARAHYYLGITYRTLGNEATANQHLQRAKQLDPTLQ
jgi:tetratricopeptide (TPR) repeat protein